MSWPVLPRLYLYATCDCVTVIEHAVPAIQFQEHLAYPLASPQVLCGQNRFYSGDLLSFGRVN